MANEPQWEPIEAPPWATKPAAPKSEPKWEPIEPPAWATKQEKPAHSSRTVLQRTGEAMAETAGGAWEAAKRAVVPPSKEEAQKYLGPSGMWRSFKETGESLLSPITGTIGTAISGAASPIASGVSEGARRITGGDPKYSEEMYERARPMAEAALGAVGRTPGIATTSKYPMPDFKVPTTKKVPGKGPEAEAGRYLESEASDPAALRRGLNQPIEELGGAGDKPTTFQHTGQLGQTERVTARQPGQVEPHLERKAAQNAARQQTLEQLQPTGDPMAVANELRAAMQAETQAADAAAAQAAQRAQQAIEAEGGRVDPTTYGNIFRRELEIAEDAARARERALWERVDPDRTLQSNPQPIQELERRVYGSMTEAGAASITPAETQIAGLIQGYRPVIPFQELRDLRSLTSGALRNELYSNGRTPAYARLSQLRQGIEEAIPRSFSAEGEAAAGVTERLREASAATRQRAETFRPTRGITRKEGVEGPYKLEDVSTIPEKIIASGTKGYDRVSQYLRAVGNERGMPELTDAVVARMRREVIGMDGEINPRKLEGFLRRYQDTLRAIDAADGGAFSARLRNIQTAQEAIETTTANQAAVAAKYKNDQFNALIGATNEADATNMIANIFGKQDSVRRAQELMRRLTTAEAQEGARAAVVRHIRERLTSNAQLGEDLLLRAEQFQTWVDRNSAALRQILRPEQVKSLEDIALSLRRANRSNQTKATGGGSDTYQMQQAGLVQQGWVRELAQRYGPAVARIMAGWLGGIPGAVAAEGVAIGARTVKASRAARAAKRMEAVQNLIDDAILNPETAKKLLGKTHTYKSKTPGTRSGAAYYGGALGAEAERDDKQKRVPRQAGGGVPAIGGTGGRSPGAGETSHAGAARQGTSQALPDGRTTLTLSYDDGGEVKQPLGFRERHAAALAGTPASGPAFEKLQTRKGLTAPAREEIRKTLQTFGITGEAAGAFGERQLGERPDVDSRADGGFIGDELHEGEYDRTSPGGTRPGAYGTGYRSQVGELLQPGGKHSLRNVQPNVPGNERLGELSAFEKEHEINPLEQEYRQSYWGGKRYPVYADGGLTRGSEPDVGAAAAALADHPTINAMERMHRSRMRAQGVVPPADELIDQTQKYVAEQLAGVEDHHEKQDPLEAAIEDMGGFRARLGEGGSDEGTLPLARADGGDVERDMFRAMSRGWVDWKEDELPLPGQSRGLGRPPDEELPAMRRNQAGETLPGHIARSWGEGLASLATAPKRAYTGELPPDEQVEEFGGPMGMLMTGLGRAPAGALGIGRSRRPASRAPKLEAGEIPAADRPVTRSHNLPPEEAPFPQFAEEYPPVGPPTMKLKDKPKFEGETYPEKTYTPEAADFMKQRSKVMKDMQKGYVPYFDPAERQNVDPSNYPGPNVDTLSIQPKKEETFNEYAKVINQPGTAQLLREAYDRGEKLGNAHDWYAMSQLEDAYVKELGEGPGREKFLDEFAVPMAATTSGNDPRANFLMAHYLEYLRKQGENIPEGHQFPAPVGGRRVNVNVRDYKAMRARGGYEGLGEDQPKMHNFSRSFIGDLSRGVMDEQMAGGSMAHIKNKAERETWADKSRHLGFGMLEKQLHQEAAKKGLQPGNFQDVAWAGFKGESSGPMIGVVNDAIERTHRLTGMPKEEIVRRGIIRKEIPIYGLTAAATPYLWGGFQPEAENNSSPSTGLPPQ